MLNQISLTEAACEIAEDAADWSERREALRIRPLIECPRLRAAMGLSGSPATTTPAPSHGVKAGQASRRMPKNSSAPANRSRTKHAAKPAASAGHPRFDRRALLDTDR